MINRQELLFSNVFHSSLVTTSLEDLRSALRGEIIMSLEIEDTLNSVIRYSKHR